MLIFLNLGVLTKESRKYYSSSEQEVMQFITMNSLLANMSRVFGVKNEYFAVMFFKYLNDYKAMDQIVHFEQFLEKMTPFLNKADEEFTSTYTEFMLS